jgi:phosphoribosylaminoimidazolecarboxamide formyltransferase/IMP cyclohydrolase
MTGMSEVVTIRRALLSVSDKTGLIELARALTDRGVELLASGGTHRALADAGIKAVEVAAHTGQPQILGGRVKTLHPKVHGGILARRDVPEDLKALEAHGIVPIDLVVVNLYPFEATVARPGTRFDDAIENIDIGGPTLIRSAAKNHQHVVVATRPADYVEVLASLEKLGGTTLELRHRLARTAFALTARYDAAISSYLEAAHAAGSGEPAEPFPARLVLNFDRVGPLRYGENPHQHAAFYSERPPVPGTLATAQILHGKEISYNNLLDLDSALRLVRLFERPAVVILKHNNPCGASESDNLASAFERAYEGDPVAAFGGIVGMNRPVDRSTAERMGLAGRFLECILAPAFDPEAFEWLTTKPTWRHSIRLVALGRALGPTSPNAPGFDMRRIEGGLLVQDWDRLAADPIGGDVVTERAPSEAERRDLAFAWGVVSAVKSNAIVLVRGGQLVGVGAGQMSRLDSVRIAVEKAGPRSHGTVLGSDAFFPFRDGPDAAAAAGVTAIVQPGGSKRDADAIAACNERGIAMIFTGRRHFRH